MIDYSSSSSRIVYFMLRVVYIIYSVNFPQASENCVQLTSVGD